MPSQNQNQPPEGAVALMRMVDFRIPLPWLLGGFIVAVAGLVSMYFQLQEVSRAMAMLQNNLTSLQISVNSGNNQSVTLSGEIALLKFRVEHLEGAAGKKP